MHSDASVPMQALWAKTNRDNPAEWHPLANHLVEVAAVAFEMWESVLAPASKDRWTDFCGGDEDAAGRWLAFLAGMHDLGKASPVFQGASDEQRTRLKTTGVQLRPKERHPLRHGTITASTLPALLRQRWPKLHPRIARRYAVLSGMHHGSVLDATTLNNASPKRDPDQVGLEKWDRVRRELFDEVLTAIEDVPDPAEEPLPYPLATWAAGFVSVADWIGSNTTYFSFSAPIDDPNQKFADARRKARRALSELGWRQAPIDVPVAFNDMYRYKGWETPNSTQAATIKAVQAMDGPGVIIVEAPMGDGKTEAAFWTAAWAQHHWGTRGLYVAMPTRASSDQLFTRLKDHLSAHTSEDEKINLLLLHGHAAISAQMEQVRRNARPFDPDPAASNPDQPEDVLLRSQWFSARKRGLLAPYGVGTVDQTLLGVLENRHYFVRLHGLAGKTLVFDEIHAYDTYMETLFAGELEALGALGAPVVLLSATLPSERRDTLLRAYAKGAGWSPEPDINDAEYPRVTTVDHTRINSVPIARSGRERTVALRWFTGSEEAARIDVIKALADALTNNHGTCAVICNTVRQAQEMFELLGAQFSGEVDLFHARFRYGDRAETQDRVLGSFGEHRGTPQKRIVVATQVIEQSLDLDFDLMVSYFCPTDLLIQRLGRMHRHESNDSKRPDSLKQPQLWVLGVGDDAAEKYPTLGVPYVSRLIYDPHVLLRSWAVLRHLGQLTLPKDIETCIEATYGSDVQPAADLAEDWQRSERESGPVEIKKKLQATGIMIPCLSEDGIANGSDPLIRNVGEKTPEDEQKQDMAASALARTRLGPSSVDVVVLTPEEFARIDPEFGDGTIPLPLAKVARLLNCSVSISQIGLYHELMARDPPRSWDRTVWLQRHRLVQLGDDHRVQIAKYELELSPMLGIVTRQPGAEEEE